MPFFLQIALGIFCGLLLFAFPGQSLVFTVMAGAAIFIGILTIQGFDVIVHNHWAGLAFIGFCLWIGYQDSKFTEKKNESQSLKLPPSYPETNSELQPEKTQNQKN
ncbi:MAG: hypothetical protein A4S09_14175 [Proteobacteria bacterium SG_bin7]|nr:MAG: hypothetical protein A4S09_14175 [Proteobacteria bacterium SG_bin7]